MLLWQSFSFCMLKFETDDSNQEIWDHMRYYDDDLFISLLSRGMEL